MFESEDQYSLEEQLAAAESMPVLRNSHRQQVFEAARQARSRKVCLQSLATLCILFLTFTFFFAMKDSEMTENVTSGQMQDWPKTIYSKSSQVLGISTKAEQPQAIKTDWNSVQATLKQSCEWGLVDAVVRFRNERAGTIEQIFHRGD